MAAYAVYINPSYDITIVGCSQHL